MSEDWIYLITPWYTTMFAIQVISPFLVLTPKKPKAEELKTKPKKKRKPRRTLKIQRMPGTTKKDMKAANFKSLRKKEK